MAKGNIYCGVGVAYNSNIGGKVNPPSHLKWHVLLQLKAASWYGLHQIPSCTCTCTHAHTYTYTHTHTHIYIYIHIHTHIHTHTHTHTHAHTPHTSGSAWHFFSKVAIGGT